jgi:hypothetical protein
MAKRLAVLAVVVGVVVPIAAVAIEQTTAATDLTVHEWGTFTSVAGQDGQAVPWHPISGASDLPCFVSQLNPLSVKVDVAWLPTLRATVRMETPVLYFYSPSDATVSVKVQFHQGLLSEWYPQATVPEPTYPVSFSGTGSIEWPVVHVRPATPPRFVTEPGSSHYYAARETDAAPVEVNGQYERFLFYRGLAGFAPTMRARDTGQDAVVIDNTGTSAVPNALVFESDGTHFGYRITGAIQTTVTVPRPELASDLTSLRHDLGALLVEQGLFPREANAMLDTWRDSWFEPGLRVLYLVPRQSVDAILPLEISPAPRATTRVFVGRLELLTMAMEAEVQRAVDRGDTATLSRYGRFLEPAMDVLKARAATDADRARLDAAFKAVSKAPAAAARSCR